MVVSGGPSIPIPVGAGWGSSYFDEVIIAGGAGAGRDL